MACFSLTTSKIKLNVLEESVDSFISEFDSYAQQNPMFKACLSAESTFRTVVEEAAASSAFVAIALGAKAGEYAEKSAYFGKRTAKILEKVESLTSQLLQPGVCDAEIVAACERIKSKAIILSQRMI